MKKIFSLFLLFSIMVVTGCNAQDKTNGTGSGDKSSQKKTDMTVAELKSRLDAGDTNLVVLDVRTADELKGELGSIPGIIHISLQELDKRANELDQHKDKEIAVICRSGNRSVTACNILRKAGHNVINVEGGMKAWRKL
jgi:rhodanese-related sulfurtransferase